MSAIFPHNDEQRNLAIGTRSREAARRGGRIYTEILPASRFHLAEAYHQKFALRGRPELLKEYEAMYPSFSDFLASTAVTRVNGYVAGYGTCETLRGEFDGLGLSPAGEEAPGGDRVSAGMQRKREPPGRHVRRVDAPTGMA